MRKYVDQKNIVNYLDVTDIYRILHSTAVALTFFSSKHGPTIDHMFTCQTILIKVKEQNMFSDHNGRELK